jgi:hypothetical protein
MNTQTKTKPTHTPTPWILQTDDNDIFVEVVDSGTEGKVLATFPATPEGCANAALIVSAVNTHEELVAALEIAMQELEANKVAMLGPGWASQRTMTGGALIICARALATAKGITA